MTGIYVSALDLFSIGIGPSSSHTVGPMRAGRMFVDELAACGLSRSFDRLTCTLHGSLGATGIGHGTPDAVIAGLRGRVPETCDPAEVHGSWEELGQGETLSVAGVPLTRHDIVFEPFARGYGHPNALTLTAEHEGVTLLTRTYLSIGGGFVLTADAAPEASALPAHVPLSAYANADGLLREAQGRSIAAVALDDELQMFGRDAVDEGLDAIWAAMSACVRAGLSTRGGLPGGLGVTRRAADAHDQLSRRPLGSVSADEWVAVYAMAVNEENAAGGRVVTAPTNGAAGVVPAVLYHLVHEGASDADIRCFLLTASAIGSIVKANASISGAEAGCQGEVGTACAMAAGGLCAVWGGTPEQVENAAEIAMEHHLGLTCDPVGGLVQIPCIERNAVAASTALTAARIALLGDGHHVVSLDTVIETMRQTGNDMSSRYKETSTGGLAVNVPYC
ncbi:L-serine ammonia-lyase [Subtercola endophyticus]|uniref:L-serine ammonia-lyase n=1 Tax=Subtercola endophyticus TaxID=2895559 RepID=UPI001E440FC0|nr:L-serine ammonia-lyase [Subtercola endophyticus]UFS58824.1 L-serine ammonia-lyase [Subtercola endophyticus]